MAKELGIDNHNIVSSEQAISIIENSVKTLMDAPRMAGNLPAILFRGAPGIGKSTIVREVARRLGIGFVNISLAQMERVDLCGLPEVKNGETKWAVPSFWPTDKDSAGIIFFDEITSAPADVQVAAYQVILDRVISNSDYRLPDKWYIVAAGNRALDRAVVKPMSSALANRFMHFELDSNPEDWGIWAIQHDIHPSVTGYIRYKPQNLRRMEGMNLEMGWPSPRSWERVSNIIPLFNADEDVLRKAVYGLVGPAVGTEFIEFHRINKRFDDVLEMMTNPNKKVVIPTKADEKHAMCSAVSYLLWNGKSEEDEQARISGFYRIALEFTADFATLLAKNAMAGNSKVSKLQACSKIIHAPEYNAFKKKFGNAFTKKYSL